MVRSSFAPIAPFATLFALARLAAAAEPSSIEWSYLPDKSAQWYTQNGQALPELAPAVTTVEQNKSYIIKLECVGCPFRVRELGEVVETWQQPSQENSLLLNLTIDDSQSGLLLNGDRIAPLAPMPLSISAFQTPANLSQATLENMTSMHMLDDSWTVGTKYGSFELQYEHAVVATHVRGRNWVQFDVLGIHMMHGHNQGKYFLDKQGQRMVQVLLREEPDSRALHIEEVQVVEREGKAKPFKMQCGKYAIVKTEYNPLEWDFYGKLGTVSRVWHLLAWKLHEYIMQIGFASILVVGFIRWRFYQAQKRELAADRAWEADLEAAALVYDYEDSPPDYDEATQHDAEKDDEPENRT